MSNLYMLAYTYEKQKMDGTVSAIEIKGPFETFEQADAYLDRVSTELFIVDYEIKHFVLSIVSA